jgi:RNA polymerase sigma-70 factor (ECF subfamily)
MTQLESTARTEIAGLADRRMSLDSKQALDRFLASVERRAMVTARLATRNSDDALDIVQDAMMRLVQHYGTRGEDEWAPLFHRILQRCIFDWYRRNRVRNRWRHWFTQDEIDEADPLENLPDPAGIDPSQASGTDRTLTALDAAIKQLPLRQQQAFLLRAVEELDVEQTARTMGCSAGSVKTHYSRAVHALRERLKDHWE